MLIIFWDDFGDKLGIAVVSATRSKEEDLRQAESHAKQSKQLQSIYVWAWIVIIVG